MSIAENIAQVRANMAAAARAAGRDPGEILLVGASKMNDAAACREAVAAGIDALGENRVQEMTAKLADHAYDGAPLHFIGHLQRNKVKQVVGKVDLIESVGSLALLNAIESTAAGLDLIQNVLLEVNIGEEEAKSGIPPANVDRVENCRYFEKVWTLFVDISAKLYHNSLQQLSMGMSADYEDAIRAGATMVRVGSAIFGSRHYT